MRDLCLLMFVVSPTDIESVEGNSPVHSVWQISTWDSTPLMPFSWFNPALPAGSDQEFPERGPASKLEGGNLNLKNSPAGSEAKVRDFVIEFQHWRLFPCVLLLKLTNMSGWRVSGSRWTPSLELHGHVTFDT